MARTPLMAGNWKMNNDHLQAIDTVQKLAWMLRDAGHDYSNVAVAVIPPFTALRSVQTLVDGDSLQVAYGAQDVSAHESGAYTGEVSASMLAKLGCTYVVVGHSERRQYHGEDDALVASKALAALGAGMVPIICLGEELEIRKEGRHVEHCVTQIEGSLAGLSTEQVAKSVIAYEPVWAIGTGEVATPEDAQEVNAALRAKIAELHGQGTADAVPILYGGSVKSSNVAEIMAKDDVDGALVGGASLDPEEFAKIVRYQSHVK
ncbi:MAG: triose-phosphate isomerase [Micrococcales bacterium]|nr:MAG: triose-phosphate isomerase [Micrococcales bacterium]PIE26184.1 MAG: triose-phosphate isomerase [Micrococcales bacterium]